MEKGFQNFSYFEKNLIKYKVTTGFTENDKSTYKKKLARYLQFCWERFESIDNCF